MQIFKDYVELIVQFKVEKNKLTVILGDDATLLRKFYEGIANRQFKTEDDAARALYGPQATHADTAFRTLKKEFKKRLQQLILLIDFSNDKSFTDFQIANYNHYKTLAVSKILSGRSKYAAGSDLGKTMFDEATKFNLTDSLLWSTRYLRGYHLKKDYDEKKIAEYNAAYEKALETYYAESKAVIYYENIGVYYSKSRATHREVEPIIARYCEELDKFKEVESPVFLVHYGMLQIFRHLSINNYRKGLEVCNLCLSKFEAKYDKFETGLAMFLTQKQFCCTMLRQYDESLAIGLRNRTMVIKDTQNWYNNTTNLMQVYLRLERPAEAWQLYKDAINLPNFSVQTRFTQENVHLYGAYLTWLIRAKAFAVSAEERAAAQDFRLNRYLNDIQVLDKDKRGLNVPILLLQILFYLVDTNEAELEKRIENLEKYKTRYTKGDDNNRTNNLIRLLRIMLDAGLQLPIIQKNPRVLKLHQELLDTVPDYSNPTHENEFFDYGTYWTYAIRTLKKEKPF